MVTRRVVVIGAGIAGLTAALAMSRNGAEVVVVDRDDSPPPSLREPVDAFEGWNRPQVVQARQPHNFLARTVLQFRQHAPDVLDMLAEHGVVPEPGPMALIPTEARVPGDEDIAWLPTRRLVLEFLLRRHVEQMPGVEIRSGTTVRGLSSTSDASGLVRLRGVVLDDGTALAADWVVDASGRRGAVADFLEEIGATPLPRRSQPCGLTYYSRHFRLLDDVPGWMVTGVRTDEPPLYFAGFFGDARTICLLLAPPTWDRDMRALRETQHWDAVARALPAVAPWVDEARAEPTTEVLAMAGHHNVLREPIADGRPTVLGYLPVGDALCITDPIYAWGASLAVTQAFAAAGAVARHVDPADVMCDYADAVMPEARIAYDLSASLDRIRDARLRGVEPESVTDENVEREALMREGIRPGILADPVLFRAYMRWLNMLDPVDAIYTDEDVVRRANAHRDAYRANPNAAGVPPREELLRLLQPARV